MASRSKPSPSGYASVAFGVNRDAVEPDSETAAGRYAQLVTVRSPYEDRARQAAELTIPGLIPPEGSQGGTLPSPWQSVGAHGVNNLASKMLLALLPPGSSFFKLAALESVVDQLKAQDAGTNSDVAGELQAALSKVERAVATRLESTNLRPTVFEAFKHLIVGGNALIVVLPKLGFKMFPLSQYVVSRDLEGTAIEILTKETLARETLPAAVREVVEAEPAPPESKDSTDPKKSIDLYTWVRRTEKGSWEVQQEVCGKIIETSRGTYAADKSAYIPLRWTAVAGEDYGRGRCEEYFGDLSGLDSLTQSLQDGASAMARILILVDEAGVTSKEDIQDAANLEVIDGSTKDISVLQMEKALDFSVAKGQADEIKQRLQEAFLLTSSIQRNAERVTAEEIRLMAGELEQALGGVYTVMAQEFQRPLVSRVLAVMQRARELPAFPEKTVSPQIVTGLDGLGRSADLTKLDLLIAGLAQHFGPEAVAEYVNVGAYAKRRGAALALDLDGLIRPEEEVQAARQQQMKAELASKLGPSAIKANADRDVAAAGANSTAL